MPSFFTSGLIFRDGKEATFKLSDLKGKYALLLFLPGELIHFNQLTYHQMVLYAYRKYNTPKNYEDSLLGLSNKSY